MSEVAASANFRTSSQTQNFFWNQVDLLTSLNSFCFLKLELVGFRNLSWYCSSKVKVILRPTVSRPVCPGVRPPSVTRNQFLFLVSGNYLQTLALFLLWATLCVWTLRENCEEIVSSNSCFWVRSHGNNFVRSNSLFAAAGTLPWRRVCVWLHRNTSQRYGAFAPYPGLALQLLRSGPRTGWRNDRAIATFITKDFEKMPLDGGLVAVSEVGVIQRCADLHGS
jgi:hypothetical protein